MAALSPSELLALLGPNAPFTKETFHSEQRASSQWTRFAESLSVAMSARLRPLVKAATRMQPSGCRVLIAEETDLHADHKLMVHFWQATGSADPVAIVLSPQIVAAFVDRMLGGRPASSIDVPTEHRSLTDVDHRLVARLIEVARNCVIERFLALTQSPIELDDLDSRTMSFEEAWMPDCPLVQLSFDLRFVQGGGTIDLLFPKEIANLFSDEPTPPQMPRECQMIFSPAETISSVPSTVTLTALLASLSLPENEVASLAVGDVLLTGLRNGEPIQILVNGRTSGHAVPGTVGLRKGIRLMNHVGMETLRSQ